MESKVILLESEKDADGFSIVLVLFNGREFVTWNRSESNGDNWGHYFNKTAEGLAAAVEDYGKRVEDLLVSNY